MFTTLLALSVARPAALTVSPDGARLWLGLKNSDDQGTRVDVRAELSVNESLVAEGESRCVSNLKRNPAQAKQVSIPFGPVKDKVLVSGDV